MSAWGPAFYKPGSGEVPASGASSSTNTGTLNFSPVPNNLNDYAFDHGFASDAEMIAAYPVGNYGILFQGTTPPAPASFTAGLAFTGGAYPAAAPQVSGATNGAVWAGGLKIKSTGTTVISLNAFPEYTTSTYGSLIGAGVYDAAGNVISSATTNSYYIPSLGVTQPAVTEISIDGALLTPGTNYTLELQYGILANPLGEASLNGTNFQGLSAYYKNTTVTITAFVPSIKSDFNGDGNSDIVWQNTVTGERTIWLLNGASVSAGVTLGGISTDWNIAGTGDFNADGKADIVWQNTVTGERSIWLMDGTAVTAGVGLGSMGTEWSIASTGDFNADGKPDLVWQNTVSGERTIWLMDGTTATAGISLGGISTDWDIAGTGDFNADGKADIVWQNTATGERSVWLMDGTTATGGISLGSVGTEWDIAGTGDFNADGKPDLVWQNTVTGERTIWLMDGTAATGGFTLGGIGTDWHIAN